MQLGHAVVNLYGPWKFQAGDDPTWALPRLDDSQWESVDLHSADEGDAAVGGGYVPGWTAQGHPNYAGYAWYRLRVDVTGSDSSLSLKMPDQFDDAYQVFVNGQQIGEFGKFSSRRVTTYSALPRGFRLPSGLRNGPMVIAIRMWMDSSSRFNSPDAGGLHGPPVLGSTPIIATLVRLDWDDAAHGVGSGFLEMLVLFLALSVALTHFWLDRSDKSYLWLGLVLLVTLLSNLMVLAVNFTTIIPGMRELLIKDVVLAPARIGLWVLFWASWFGLGPPRWMLRTVWVLVALLALGNMMLRPPLQGQVIPMHAGHYLIAVLLWVKLALAALLIWVTIDGIRRGHAEGWLALPAILLSIVANYQAELRLIHVPITFSVLGFDVSIGEASTIASLILITMMGSRRFLAAQRRKVQWRLEVDQARELQKVIIPSELPKVPGLRIESDYRPSREVGGDFFQIIPNRADGSVLVLVGDVTGKGLRAGMLVALIVGAVDAAAKNDPDPQHVLSMVNDRLCERGYATATCLAMKITAEGWVSVVNAGHLPPYLNGRELEMEGALPLGTLPGADYSTVRVQLQDGDSLVLTTDGVVEAQDEDGTLFGFERLGNMIADRATPADVADAAQRFGQEDDILVLRVERTVSTSLLEPAAA